MISNPKHGWCDFNLGTFYGTPSYLTNVPVDLLEAFRDYVYKGQGIAWFDEEGTEFTLVITPYSLYVIEEKDDTILHNFSEMKIEEVIKKTITDIEINLDKWAAFSVFDDNDMKEIKENEYIIKDLIAQIKEAYIKQTKK